MNFSRQRVFKALTSRLALNLYYWVFYAILEFGINFYGRRGQYHYPQGWYILFRATTTLLFAALLYANNLWLIPRYFVKKKYGKYLLIWLLIAYATGLCLAGLFEMLDVRFPKMAMRDVTMFNAMRVFYPANHKIIFFEAISWMFSLAISTTEFTVAWYMQDYAKQKRRKEEAEKKQVETELNFLKSQINPHFLFNTLNNLYTLTIMKSESAPDVVAKLSSILRYLLYESNINKVSFEKEKEIMQAVIDLELLRLSNKNNMLFTIETDKPYNMPPLLWVPVLENVFKHGTRYISNEYFIDYRFTIQNDHLSIYSKNSYKPSEVQNGADKEGGIGLSNLQKRLNLLYPGKHSLHTSQEGNFFITTVQIQLA